MVPFLKWAGGKRWLFDREFISGLPGFERYVEPFMGGAAGFFALEPKRALLCDVNAELVNLYLQVRDRPDAIKEGLIEYQRTHSKHLYYAVRSKEPIDPLERALRLLYLNRTCWNGLYRLNRRGEFNVPIGSKTKLLLDSDNFLFASHLLKRAELVSSDFEKTLAQTGAGDLVFIDPPYTVKHNMNGFVKYNESIFTWSDQVRLKDCASAAMRRGAAVVMTNADHESIRELYSGAKTLRSVERSSVIAGANSARARTTELLITL